MEAAVQPAGGASRKMLWAGRIVSAIPALLLLFGGAVKIAAIPSVVEGFAQYGYPQDTIVVIGLLEVGCTLVYLVPRLSVLGAILMSALLGGATAANVRVHNPAWIFPVLMGVLVWLGVWLREARLRQLIPWRYGE